MRGAQAPPMRTILLTVGLVALSASADDDGYYQRQFEQRQFDQRQFELQQQRRAQDRIDQQRTDELFNQQQARLREINEQGARNARRNNDTLMQLSAQSGLTGKRALVPRPRCEDLILPREQEVDASLTGYFTPDRSSPYFMTSLTLGPKGAGQRMVFTAHLHDGELPAVAKTPFVELTVYQRRNGATATFKAVSGAVTFSSARQNPQHGKFRADITDLTLVEMDGYVQRKGGACLHAATFWVDGSWTSKGNTSR